MVWCGVVRCGAVRCGAVRCGAMRCDAMRCNVSPLGIWKNKEELLNLPKSSVMFEPDPLVHDKYIDIYKQWVKAVRRCMHWNV